MKVKYAADPEKYRKRARARYHEDIQRSRASGRKRSKTRDQEKKREAMRRHVASNIQYYRELGRRNSAEKRRVDGDAVRKYQRSYQANRRANLVSSTPKWTDMGKIKEIYDQCPEDYHVDHIIPLAGVHVCGLHVPDNLQYLERLQNIRKSNQFRD